MVKIEYLASSCEEKESLVSGMEALVKSEVSFVPEDVCVTASYGPNEVIRVEPVSSYRIEKILFLPQNEGAIRVGSICQEKVCLMIGEQRYGIFFRHEGERPADIYSTSE